MLSIDQVKESDGRNRGRYNKRSENRYHDEYDNGDEEEQRILKSPASPLVSPRNKNGQQAAEKPQRLPPPSSPKLLRSRSPNNLSPRTPSPTPRVAGGKEYIAYYEEDVDLRPKSKSPRDKKQDRIPSLRSNGDSQPSYKKRSPRDLDGDGNFDWNNYISPRSRNNSYYDDEDDERETNQRTRASPREHQGGGDGGRRHERARGSVDSPPLSPLASSGVSLVRSSRESARTPDDLRLSWESRRSEKDYLSSSADRSPRDEIRTTHVPPISRGKNKAPVGGKLEPIEYR